MVEIWPYTAISLAIHLLYAHCIFIFTFPQNFIIKNYITNFFAPWFKMADEATQRVVSEIPVLKTNAGPKNGNCGCSD